MPDADTRPHIRRKLANALPVAIGIGIVVVVGAGMLFSLKTTALILGIYIWLTFEVALIASAIAGDE